MRSNIVLQKRYIPILLIFFFLLLIVACAPLLGDSPQQSSTQTAFGQVVMDTVTARALLNGKSGDELATALAQATALSGTATAQVAIDSVAYQGTATAILPILEELPHYGVTALQGDVAWLHEPVTLNLKGYQQAGYANNYPQITAKDFVLSADITWNTQFGDSGCGFMFRSDANKKNPNQLMVILTRSAEGSLIFTAMADGKATNMQVYYPLGKDKSFKWQNDTTNRLVVVARGKLIDLYTNGVLIGQVDTSKPPPSTIQMPSRPTPPSNPTDLQQQEYAQQVAQYQQARDQLSAQILQAQRNYYSNKVASLSEGFLGFMGMTSAGSSVCTFNNAWLFLIRPAPTKTRTPTPTFNGTIQYHPPTATPTMTDTQENTPYLSSTPIPTNTFTFDTPVPTAVPPTDIPPTDVPPTDIPPTDVPPTSVPPTAGP